MDKDKGSKTRGGPHPLAATPQQVPKKTEEPSSPEIDSNLQVN